VPKSASQLDAEIAEVLTSKCDTRALNALISAIERAIDAHPELTRQWPGKRGIEEAELVFRGGDWTARCKCRNKRAKGTGARLMHSVWAAGPTPEEAADALIDQLPITAESLR
jgi:hypothetical protein